MKKVFDQTVRDIKREVNKKVLKVPGIEQKVLDATSNETWGPHGSDLADIAQASKNFQEFRIIMGIIWKRLNDTGKNWRHVYKALIVLEYMVGHGSERVVDEIQGRTYQILTLGSFQYIDSTGRDQGSNVRKKSQSLLALVNDKDKIVEARQKAAANMDKYRNSGAGRVYRPAGGYGGRDEERDSNGREREYGYWDDDKYSRYVDRYSRDSEDRYGRDGYRDEDYNGRSRDVDNQNGSRSKSSDRDQALDDDGQSPSRGNGVGAEADDHPRDGRKLEREFSEQKVSDSAPPSYTEAAIRGSQSPLPNERDGGEAPQIAASAAGNNADETTYGVGDNSSPPTQQAVAFNEFDPRAGLPASASLTSNNAEMDLLGSLSEVLAPNTLVSVESNGQTASVPPPSFAASQSSTQPFNDPFGESPFKATDPSSHTDSSSQPMYTLEPSTTHDFGFGDTFSAAANPDPSALNMQPPSSSQVSSEEQLVTSQSDFDILAGILPPSGPTVTSIPAPQLASTADMYGTYHPQPVSADPNVQPQTPFGQAAQPYHVISSQAQTPFGQVPDGLASSLAALQYAPQAMTESYLPQPGTVTSSSSQTLYQTPSALAGHFDGGNFTGQWGLGGASPVAPHCNNGLNDIFTSAGPSSQPALTPSIGVVPQAQTEKKFELKSGIWADTMSRGLVNLNISGSKINPLADLGVDFDAINRKDKRLEKPTSQVTSTVTMGKAMGSGSGMGRAGATPIRPPPTPMVASNMPMGPSGGYGGMNQHPLGMGMGMNPGGYGQGYPMQPPQPGGYNPGPAMPSSGYNPMMGQGGYNPQQPYGGYR